MKVNTLLTAVLASAVAVNGIANLENATSTKDITASQMKVLSQSERAACEATWLMVRIVQKAVQRACLRCEIGDNKEQWAGCTMDMRDEVNEVHCTWMELGFEFMMHTFRTALLPLDFSGISYLFGKTNQEIPEYTHEHDHTHEDLKA